MVVKLSNEVAELKSNQLAQEIGFQLKRAYIKVVEQYHLDVGKYQLRPSEYSLLCILDENSGVTAKKLSPALKIAPPNLVTILDNLEKRNLLTKTVNPQDRRSQIIQITKVGKSLLVKAQRASIQAQEVAIGRLNTKERETLVALLQKIH